MNLLGRIALAKATYEKSGPARLARRALLNDAD